MQVQIDGNVGNLAILGVGSLGSCRELCNICMLVALPLKQ